MLDFFLFYQYVWNFFYMSMKLFAVFANAVVLRNFVIARVMLTRNTRQCCRSDVRKRSLSIAL